MISTIKRVRILMFLTVACSIIFFPFVDWTITTVFLSILMYFVYDCLGVIVANHRYWSHKSFEFRHPILKYICSLSALLSGSGSTLGWAGLHRLHHKHSDTDKDPHQQSRGFFKTLFIYYEADQGQLLRASVDNARDKFLRITDKYWGLIILFWAVLLFAIDPQVLYFIFIVPSSLTMLAQGMTNYMCHKKNKAVNCFWIAPFNWGEAWHKNHHDNPGLNTTKQKWYELDISGLVIKAISK